jgi:drug/metabolite transporter (DMT)-like permease
MTQSAPAQATASAKLDSTAVWVVVGCSLLWGLNQIAVKWALPEVPPLLQVALRSGVAWLLLWGFARRRGLALWSAQTWRAGLLAGLFFGLEFACIYVGLQFTSASRMTVFLYLAPFVVALCMPWLNARERLSRSQWLGLLGAFSGVAVAFWEGLSAPALGPRQWWGDSLGIVAALLWAATTLLIRGTALARAPASQTLSYQLGVTALLMGAASLGLEPLRWPAWGQLSGGAWLSLLFQAVVVSFASYLAWFWLLARYPASRLATFTLLTPVAGLCFGVLMLGETLTWQLGLGLLAVVCGIVWVNSRRD